MVDIKGLGLTGNYLWASSFIIIAILFVVDISAKRIEFALTLLAAAIPKVDKKVYRSFLFWTVPLPMFAQNPRFGVYEDLIMFVAGIYGLIMLVKNWKVIGK